MAQNSVLMGQPEYTRTTRTTQNNIRIKNVLPKYFVWLVFAALWVGHL